MHPEAFFPTTAKPTLSKPLNMPFLVGCCRLACSTQASCLVNSQFNSAVPAVFPSLSPPQIARSAVLGLREFEGTAARYRSAGHDRLVCDTRECTWASAAPFRRRVQLEAAKYIVGIEAAQGRPCRGVLVAHVPSAQRVLGLGAPLTCHATCAHREGLLSKRIPPSFKRPLVTTHQRKATPLA